ncbi:MAG: BamA/TamA family outer membrane protein [Sphingobium sp.]|uniref:autotransporter assembly complex protein TamA n=1 Tax=Sphingobium sp. TaxID=1912891 RepID=UPI001831154F|nr:BamA/TamA family outer membrane protein [Sphingobium sp.]MBU0657718.1 BamA/TamA family outer membrane protein [Alphaproteobacteria bacterium]MBA4753465.1 BamA/TamA family outer membrane protein [Sphingobium sp.]MBU1257001.1 BamA/TamA family outer membrane protein [Alphaproteobacteria bacterium]MBU1462281.1 BamA/TamA family outer membrane protein [Alphaproteobacteria bacterium]MBU1795289.1 BamA/TamA family outer membrane protein [Alphaproteobacteria bacterium]
MIIRQAHHVRHMLGLLIATASPLPLLAQTPPPATTPSLPYDATQAEEPILPDGQFEARLPQMEGSDPAKPLPSIDSWIDQQMPSTGAAAELPPAIEPAEEQELAQPLPPLDSVTVPANVAADSDPNAKLPDVRYATRIEGFGKTGLEDEFRDASALIDGDGKAETAAMVQARAQEDEKLAVRLFYSEGYYDATALASLDQTGDGTLTAVISVTPGKRYKLGDIIVQAGPTVPPGLVRDSLPLKTGDYIVATTVEGAEANVALRLPEQGYAFAKVGERDILLDPATVTGAYTLPVDTGPRGTFRKITTSGEKQAFGADHIEVIRRYKPGEIYDSRKVDDLRKALVATGLFSSVAVDPVRTNEAGPDGTEYVDLHVEQAAGPPRTLAGEVGYGTGQGFRAEGTWTHRNLFPPEGALIAGVVAGTQEQGVSGTFRRSNAGKRDKTFQAGALINHQKYDAYEAFTAGLNISWARQSTPIFQKRWTYTYGAEILLSNEQTTIDPATGQNKRLTYFIGALPVQVGYDRSDDLLNPTKGFRASVRVSPEASLQGNVSPYVRGTFDLTGYYPVSDSLVIAARTRLGTISGVSRDDVAPSRRIYAGGGGSVRGYGYQELGPKDVNNDPIGGRSVNEFAVEGRYRFGNYGAVAFVDAGQVYNSAIPKFSDMRYGVGIGGRFYTNFGPFRADIAMPINRQPGESKFAVYIGIGQAF